MEALKPFIIKYPLNNIAIAFAKSSIKEIREFGYRKFWSRDFTFIKNSAIYMNSDAIIKITPSLYFELNQKLQKCKVKYNLKKLKYELNNNVTNQ